MEDFATLMMQFLAEKNMSQQTFADSLNWNKSQVSNYKSGRFKPSYATIRKIKSKYPDFPFHKMEADFKVTGYAPVVSVEKNQDAEILQLYRELNLAKDSIIQLNREASENSIAYEQQLRILEEQLHEKDEKIYSQKKRIDDLEDETRSCRDKIESLENQLAKSILAKKENLT